MSLPAPPQPWLPRIAQTIAYTAWPLQLFEQCIERYGDPFTLSLPGIGDFVMVTAPELIKQVMTGDPELYPAGKANAMLAPVVGRNSLLLLDGKAHLRQRRLLLPPLHGERMHAYARLMAELTMTELGRMPLSSQFALHEHMQSITLNVILRAVLGMDSGPEMSALASLLVEFMTPPPMWMIFFPQNYLPYTDLPGSPYRAFLRRRDRVDRALRQIIRARQAMPDAARTDVLSLLLSARDEDGQPMSEDELRDELVTMLLAGHETSATALSWAFAFILHLPEVEARLRTELEVARRADGTIDLAALTACEYLDAVIKESMRLRPILTDVVRMVEQPTRIGGYEVPVGHSLTPCIYLAHRRKESWPEPERFLPERFIGAKIDPYTFLPFGGGIRRCIGMAFAMYEMKIVLGCTLLRTRMRLATDEPLKVMRRNITLAPDGGLPVVLLSRKAEPVLPA